MKERLIELLIESFQKVTVEGIADYLINAGVIVPQCKVGDTIYEIDGEHGIVPHVINSMVFCYTSTATSADGYSWNDTWDSMDMETAYKTREAAEAAFGESTPDSSAETLPSAFAGEAGKSYWPPRELTYGMFGPDVVAMQCLLVAHGYPTETTGVFDNASAAQLKAFQAKKGLKNDGIAGAKTWAELTRR